MPARRPRRWTMPLGIVALVAVGVALGLAGAAVRSDSAPTTTSTRPTTTTSSSTTTTVPTTTTTAPADRPIGPVAHAPMATVGDLVLLHPTARVERVGFHESTLDGAMDMTPLPEAVQATTLGTRLRGHGSRTAADIVSDPNDVVRSPVTGTVISAGPYSLYCTTYDETVVIVPDGHPTWSVRVLHIDRLRVGPGWRVEAGKTILAVSPRKLPFTSQIDRMAAAQPPWPHVHVEVDDDTIPDTPSKGDSC